MTVRVDEFINGYGGSSSVEDQLNAFIRDGNITRDKLIDIKYTMAIDSDDSIKHSALLIWDDKR